MADPKKTDKFVFDKDEIASIYGVTSRTIEYWAKNSLPSVAPGRYDIRQVVPWHESMEKKKASSKTEDEEKLLKAKADEQTEKAAMAAMKRAQMAGELIDREESQREVFRIITAIKTMLVPFPDVSDRLAYINDPKEIRRVLGDAILLAFNGMADEATQAAVDKFVANKLVDQVMTVLGEYVKDKQKAERAVRSMFETGFFEKVFA